MARAMFQPGFARGGIARDEPVECALHSGIAPFAADIGHHWPVGDMVKSFAIKAREEIALVRITKERLAARRGGHRGDRIRGDTARAIAAAREPDGIDVRAVCHLDQGCETVSVLTCEMTVYCETLLVEHQLDPRIADRGDGAHGFGVVRQDRGGWGDDTNAHELSLFYARLERPDIHRHAGMPRRNNDFEPCEPTGIAALVAKPP